MTTSLFPNFINHSRSFQSLRSDDTPIPLMDLPPLPNPPTSLIAPCLEPLLVPNQFLCPNINCTITGPHTYVFSPHLLPPSDLHHILLSRFRTIPFPGSNIWTIEDEPPFLFRPAHTIYSEIFGVLRLEHIGTHTRGEKKWAVFSGSEADGSPIRALIYIPVEWTLFPVPDPPRFSFLTNLFSWLSVYSC